MTNNRIHKVNSNDNIGFGKIDITGLELLIEEDFYYNNSYEVTSGLREIYKLFQEDKPKAFVSLKGKRTPLYIEKIKDNDLSPYSLMNYNVNSIPLKEYSKIQTRIQSPSIFKENRQYIRIITFEYYGAENFGENFVKKTINDMGSVLPLGFSIERIDNINLGQNNERNYSILILLIVVIYLICVLFFESLKLPFFIIITIPLSFIGLFMVFVSGDYYFDQGGYAAFLMLGGLVVNSAIFILNDYNQSTVRIQARKVTKASWGKIWPIILTVISGLIPFLMYGKSDVFWFSFSVGMIGGLIFSILIVLIIIPTFMISFSTNQMKVDPKILNRSKV